MSTNTTTMANMAMLMMSTTLRIIIGMKSTVRSNMLMEM